MTKKSLVLGSISQVKIDATKAALAALGIDVELITVKAASGAPEQPVSDEVRAGAMNRALDAKSLAPDADAWIAIENGIFPQLDGSYTDEAVVILLFLAANYFTAFSDGVTFPVDAVEEARNRGFDKWTVGKVMQELGIVAQHDDPHLTLSGKPRAEYLQEAIEVLLKQAQKAGLL